MIVVEDSKSIYGAKGRKKKLAKITRKQ